MMNRFVLSLLALLYLSYHVALAQNRHVTKCEYWIDGNEKQEVAVNGESVTFAVDASGMSEGLHTLNYQVMDSEGLYSSLQTWMFIRDALRDGQTENTIVSVEYWFDGKTDNIHTLSASKKSVNLAVDASALDYGFHTLSYRVKDARGNYCATETWAFFRNNTKATKIAWYKYWWNDHQDKSVQQFVENNGEEYTFAQELEVPQYAINDEYSKESVARFHIVFADDKGNLSSLMWADVEYPDIYPPVSTIIANKEEASGSVTLTWSTNEDVDFYNIYYSENNQPFVLWMSNTTKTTATFKGQAGSTYRFTVTALDNAGNMERLNENKCVAVKFVSTN